MSGGTIQMNIVGFPIVKTEEDPGDHGRYPVMTHRSWGIILELEGVQKRLSHSPLSHYVCPTVPLGLSHCPLRLSHYELVPSRLFHFDFPTAPL